MRTIARLGALPGGYVPGDTVSYREPEYMRELIRAGIERLFAPATAAAKGARNLADQAVFHASEARRVADSRPDVPAAATIAAEGEAAATKAVEAAGEARAAADGVKVAPDEATAQVGVKRAQAAEAVALEQLGIAMASVGRARDATRGVGAEDTEKEGELAPEEVPITQRAWFWPAIGAAGLLGVFLLTRKKKTAAES
jgi:hypothetical protein